MTTSGPVCKVVNVFGKYVVLNINGHKLEINREFLPANVKVDQEFRLFFLDKDEASLKEKNLAKEILEEILNGKE
ncbi:hypothetical protein A2V71_02150 [Candidatus Berkelbacteria bacterium RBG_13_40_8]|uniref:DUF3006 domain-containing protein n=1 Tax=Candidatus Berkelbacteria bacterium RBG_13_40_8 TaxID=1797467 RepID=A0A1F5DQ78_9BACT|nr:MAG: hypothetical protein A2V71_02150 [Candidatus Berkelbacteria bacterium RBG_13_40_8]